MALRNFTDEEEKEIAQLYLSGLSAKEIMRQKGLAHHISIMSALRRQGIEQRPVPDRNRLYTLNPNVFDSIDNEKAAYFWGYLYADGHVHKRSLIIKLAYKDTKLLQKLKEFTESQSPIKELYVGSSQTSDKKFRQSALELTDRHLADRMIELGVTPQRLYPERIFTQLPEFLANHWIRGYFDGDGSARKAMSIALVGQQELLKWIRRIFSEQAGTNPDLSIAKHRTANIYYLYIGGRVQALNVAKYMYKDATIWLERKREVIDNWPLPQTRYRNDKGQWM